MVVIFLIVHYALLSNSIQERKQSHVIFMTGQIHLKTDLQNEIGVTKIAEKVCFMKSAGKARKCYSIG